MSFNAHSIYLAAFASPSRQPTEVQDLRDAAAYYLGAKDSTGTAKTDAELTAVLNGLFDASTSTWRYLYPNYLRSLAPVVPEVVTAGGYVGSRAAGEVPLYVQTFMLEYTEKIGRNDVAAAALRSRSAFVTEMRRMFPGVA